MKHKKKRTKRYAGSGASQGPVVRRYEAADRGRLGQWLYEHKLRVRIIGTLAAVAGILTLLISGIAGLFR